MEKTVVVCDRVPAELRRKWSEMGYYPDRDVFTLFAYNTACTPSRIAVIDDTQSVDYATLYQVVVQLAQVLRQSGIQERDVVGVQLPNSWRSVAVELAVAAVGAVVLAYPIGRGARGTLSMLRRAEAAAVIVPAKFRGEGFAQPLLEMKAELPQLRQVFVIDGKVPGAISLTRSFVPRSARQASRFVPPSVDPNGPARILVSSGSEAEPKMVLYSHNALVGGRGAFIAGLRSGAEEMRCLYTVPLGSAFGSNATFVTIAGHGETLLLTAENSTASILRMIEDHAATHMFLVPTLLDMLMNEPACAATDVSSLRVIGCGGARAAASTIERCMRTFPARFVNVYGSADGVNCHNTLQDSLETILSHAGKQRPEVTTIIACDDDGREVPLGAVGELYSRGPMSPMCYYAAPELDERYRTRDGWVRSGDYGSIDAEGYVTLRGRKKEIIIRNGYNVSPAELELLIQDHPKVRHVACFGVPDDLKGERVCICIVGHDTDTPVTLDEIKAYLVEQHRLEHKKLPDLLYERSDMPLSPAGKVHKAVLRDEVVEKLGLHPVSLGDGTGADA